MKSHHSTRLRPFTLARMQHEQSYEELPQYPLAPLHFGAVQHEQSYEESPQYPLAPLHFGEGAARAVL
ncbi:hypothetical protein NDU88_008401 [Pleurodeles waltl]|uniref:Uncharacterized protein n=1 Tax=Pleurodeles waltl TaxID=8319 RepID=A0AAV7SV49_PLEWA|nr:hypothetical protein NDU88_008401 [Pleurodeles waltl]